MFKGYASQLKISEVHAVEFATVEPIRDEQHGASVLAHQFVRLVGSDAAEAASAQRDIKATGHAARKGDVIRVTSGTFSGRESKVRSVSADNIYLVDDIILADTDTFDILRHKYPTVDADGNLNTNASLTPTPVIYDLNGVDTEVKQDTGTPANSRPLPIQYLNSIGVRTDLATQTTLAALLTELQLKADLTETQPVSVASLPLPSGAATQTTLAALLAELQLKADLTETQPVSVSGVSTAANQATELTRIGDVTEAAPASDTASSGLNGRLQRAAQNITTMSAKLPATLGQKAMSASLAVAIASDQGAVPASQSGTWNINNIAGTVSLPTGAATQTTLAALLTELQLKADLTENQPVINKTSGGTSITGETIGSNHAIHQKALGSAFKDSARCTSSVTTGAWTQLIASTAAEAQMITVNENAGVSVELGVGGAGSESRVLLVPPGGMNGAIPLRIPASSRLSVRAVSGTAAYSSTVELLVNLLG